MNQAPRTIEQKLLSRDVTYLTLCAFLTSGIALSDQIFLGQGDREYLDLHVTIMLLPFMISAVALVLGHSLLIILAKDASLLASACSVGLGFLAIFSLAILLFQNQFLEIYELTSRKAFRYATLMNLAALLSFANSFITYLFILKK